MPSDCCNIDKKHPSCKAFLNFNKRNKKLYKLITAIPQFTYIHDTVYPVDNNWHPWYKLKNIQQYQQLQNMGKIKIIQFIHCSVIILFTLIIASACNTLPEKSGFIDSNRYVQVSNFNGQCPKNPTLEMQTQTMLFFSGKLAPCCMYQSKPYMYYLYYGFLRRKIAKILRPVIEDGQLINVSYDKKEKMCTLTFEIKGTNLKQTLTGIRVTKKEHDLLIKKFLKKGKQKK